MIDKEKLKEIDKFIAEAITSLTKAASGLEAIGAENTAKAMKYQLGDLIVSRLAISQELSNRAVQIVTAQRRVDRAAMHYKLQ